MYIHNVLLVDDEFINRKILHRAIESENIKIYEANDGFEALDIIQKEHIDLILLDVMMPKMSGYEVCETVKKNPETSDIPIIFVTALHDKKSMINGLEKGAIDFISKPIDIFNVRLRVKQHLHTRELYLEVKRNQEYMKKDLLNAKRIQMNLLPQNNQKISSELTFSYKYLPCDELGGDFLDFYKIDDENYYFYIADVSGHGVASSLITIYVKEFFHKTKALINIKDPATHLKLLNESILEMNFGEYYLTLFLGIINIKTYKIIWSFAGPNTTPQIFTPDKTIPLEMKAVAIGWFPNITWSNRSAYLPKNSTLFLYSDAATEVFDKNDKELGVNGLKNMLEECKFRENNDFELIQSKLLNYSVEGEFADDLTLISLRRN